MSEFIMYLFFGGVFLFGAITGGMVVYLQVRRYREALGLPADPFEPNRNTLHSL